MTTPRPELDPNTGEPVQSVRPPIDPSTGEPMNPRKPPPLSPLSVRPNVASDMFKAGVHSKMLGVSPGVAYDNREQIQQTLGEHGGTYDDGQLDPTIANDIKTGLQGSIFGLMKRDKLPDQVKSAGMVDNFITGAFETVADLPWMLVGGAAGGAAGSEVPVVGNVVGAGAGAFALPAAMREALMQGIKHGDIQSLPDLLHRAAAVTWEATKGAVVGAATELAGGLPVGKLVGKSAVASKLVKGAYQATALTTAADLLDGRVPTAKDFAGNAALIIPLNLITHGMPLRDAEARQATMDVYAKDGTTPAETTGRLNAQPPVKPDLPEGLRPAIKTGEGFVDGDTAESHADVAERSLSKRPVTLDQLEADPSKADSVLETPAIHPQDVIDKAWQLKSDAIDAGEKEVTYEYPEYYDRYRSAISELQNLSNKYDSGRFSGRDGNSQKGLTIAAQQHFEELSPQTQETIMSLPSIQDMETGETLDPSQNVHHFRTSHILGMRDAMDAADADAADAAIKNPLSIDDLYDRNTMKSGRGFTTPDGQFLSRMEARKWMKENEPDVHEMWLNEAGGDKQAELRSADYAEARNRVSGRNVAEGDPTIANVSSENVQRLAAAREGLNKIKANLGESTKYGKEVLRTLFAGQRDTRIAATTQLRDSLKKLIPDFHDQEALSILRDYKHDPAKLGADLEQISAGDNERMKALVPSIERAMNPTPALLEADAKLTEYYSQALSEGQQLGFMESSIDPANYSPHILTRILDGEKPTSGKGGPMATSTPFAKERAYPTILDALKTEKIDARTVNALDALSVYGDRHATVVATKILATELKNTELGKYGSADKHPDGWVEMAPGQGALRNTRIITDTDGESHVVSQGLYVPKEVAEAMKPLFESGLAGTSLSPLLKAQGYVKALELGLSLFHVKALNITAFNNMGLTDFSRSILADTKTPEFAEAERGWAADGLTTSKTATPYEAYQGLKKSSIPETGFAKLKDSAVVQKADAAFRSITEYTFDVVQRKFKVQDASLKIASWMAKNPEATNTEYFDARRSIAKEVNSAYGGLNWDVLGTGKTVRDVSRLVLLAPDWTFSNVLTSKYAFEGGPAGSAARQFWAKSFATGFAMTAAASKAIGGKYDPTDIKHIDQVYLGKDDKGKDMYANWFFAGAPKDAITLFKRSAADSPLAGTAEFVVSKASPFLSLGFDVANNTKGGSKIPIRNAKDSTLEQSVEVAKYAVGRVVPITGVSAVKTVLDALSDPNHEYSYRDLLEIAADVLGSQATHTGGSGKTPTASARGNGQERFQRSGARSSRFTIKGKR